MDEGKRQTLRLREGTDPQSVLRALSERTSVEHFEVARPSLHDVFLRIAGPRAREGAADG